jgi:hypothetical protein
MAKRKTKRRKPKVKLKPPIRVRRVREDKLKTMVREAARIGLAEAIEHCSNFWNVSDGYKKYIEQQIEHQSQALMAAVRTVLQERTRKRRR